MHDKEIEIQVQVEHIGALREYLIERAELISTSRQVDEYFTPLDRDFVAVHPVREWLRLRDADGKASINYKNWHPDADGKTRWCDEFETSVASTETMRKILGALGFRSIVTVDKQRETWVYKQYEIALDSVKGLGDFVEIEYKGSESAPDHKTITNEMVQFLKDLRCGQIKRNYQGYPFMLLFPEEVKQEVQ